MDEYERYRDDDDDSGERTVNELEDVHSTLKEILSIVNSRTDFSGWLWVIVFIMFLESWPGSKFDKWTDQAWYSFRYDADFKNVTVEKRPSNCDFFRAPVGSKGCEYKKSADVFGPEQRQALIQEATTPEERQAYARRPNSVSVYWEKEEE